MGDLRHELENLQLSVSQSLGDGHCLFYSFVASWNSQFPHRPKTTLDAVIKCCLQEYHRGIDLYANFIDESISDRDTQLQRYIERKNYNQPICDIFPQILANGFCVNVSILNEKRDQQFEYFQAPTISENCTDTLYLHRINDNHYNGLVGREISKIPNAPQKCTYSRDFLLSANSSGQISRPVRKTLFKYQLWKPRVFQNHSKKWTLVRRKNKKSRLDSTTKQFGSGPKTSDDENISGPALSNIFSVLSESEDTTNVVTADIKPHPDKHIKTKSKLTKSKSVPSNKYTVSSDEGIKIGLLNPCSVCNKALLIRDLINTDDLDILALTEVWQPTDPILSQLVPDGYNVVLNLRCDGRKGGGVAVVHRDNIKCSILEKYNFPSLDAILVKLIASGKVFHLCVLYASESKVNATSSNRFIKEFSPILLDDLSSLKNILLVGDFNYHVNKRDDAYASTFLGLLNSCGFKQHIDFPTHVRGKTLDLVISRDGELRPAKISFDGKVSPDHFTVTFHLDFCKPTSVPKVAHSRNWKMFSLDNFLSELSSAGLDRIKSTSDVSEAVKIYNSVLEEMVNKHAPLCSKVRRRRQAPWYNDSIRQAKRNRRQLERRWRKSKLFCHWEDYRVACNEVNYKLKQAHQEYYHQLFENSKSQKEVFQIGNSLLFGKSSKILPDYDSAEEMAERFINYFKEKIELIRQKLPNPKTVMSRNRSFGHRDQIIIDRSQACFPGGNC
jgi:hypothetical protein